MDEASLLEEGNHIEPVYNTDNNSFIYNIYSKLNDYCYYQRARWGCEYWEYCFSWFLLLLFGYCIVLCELSPKPSQKVPKH